MILSQIKKKDAVSSLEKDFFKSMDNSVFGKTMENLRKRTSVKLINNSKDYVRCVSKPNFISQKIFSKNFVAIHQIKPVLILNEPIYVGFSILDLSKLLMYKFRYRYIRYKFNARLLFTDIDSLIYEIKKVRVYEDFYQDKDLFDFSEYSSKSKLLKVIGKMKDEFKGKIISQFVGLNSKMYSLINVDDQENTKARVNKKVRHKYFADVLFNEKVIRHNMKRNQNKLHRIGTYNICKISLSYFDD